MCACMCVCVCVRVCVVGFNLLKTHVYCITFYDKWLGFFWGKTMILWVSFEKGLNLSYLILFILACACVFVRMCVCMCVRECVDKGSIYHILPLRVRVCLCVCMHDD